MIDHERDLAHVHEATERLLDAAASLDNAAAAEPSRLPGWTRGHVLAHVARNADALVNVLQGRPMYPDAATRDADIERDSGRPLDVHLADLRASADRFRAVGAEPADWSRTVELRNGVLDSASRIPFRRWVEVALHHVDLGVGYELEDLPEEFVQREIDFLAERFKGLESVPATVLRTAGGPDRTTGGGLGGVVVTGPDAEVLGWLAGRRDGSALKTEGGPLPELPPL
ncbi:MULTISPECIES: maleylpyruvate isomerase family mycothiol-dependent enzyme [Streptomyces]|uniref:Maleylpyruvate isomerase, mycothiol-dependent n=1 Tax=Streptomyces venezuelae (strain ATCC 10712 / CBS 650.69 / DSM 40230 / JCM 4526 / NBRC 13096 / PD 04745) TaxID=953739 RepID=F2RGR4_STRVP|nr:maleylpyruvate isomerase family mycothiol-dependent enzyme [Streptomyces venezuelae]APE20924.1 mycothiol maleylpyruvate isomerase [Streptomyces venezuelae]QER98320.1 maleylpyruvate isomerase family mycothiol-dependent enzyme [Streptomyces venezuelae ATCC 10712]QES05520.1 maleylpyruvate isomerase family mycothiol-dependent enzyme [Streptomyces venezuelae]CCA54875.1 Maleylpyruvate isomerase, mycothiol-dependent [Streptomyces venezuelae ATCC 10712]